MTFHGEARGNREVMAHVHESPNVMLVPLYVLAAGAIAAGFLFKEYFIGHEFTHFWQGAVAENEIMHKMHEVPAWVVWSPFVAMVAGTSKGCEIIDVPATVSSIFGGGAAMPVPSCSGGQARLDLRRHGGDLGQGLARLELGAQGVLGLAHQRLGGVEENGQRVGKALGVDGALACAVGDAHEPVCLLALVDAGQLGPSVHGIGGVVGVETLMRHGGAWGHPLGPGFLHGDAAFTTWGRRHGDPLGA